MRIELISFTSSGAVLNRRLCQDLERLGYRCRGYEKRAGKTAAGLLPVEESLREWTRTHFESGDVLLFIGAAAIAVRSIAPYLQHKLKDPAVIVMDEAGQFCIPILSGHVGGANAFARKIAELTGAVPVITTATDINSVFAVDQFAAEQGLSIRNPERIKRISASLLEGGQVTLGCEYPVTGKLPDGIVLSTAGNVDVLVAVRPFSGPEAFTYMPMQKVVEQDKNSLILIPRIISLGIGCRRDTPASAIEALVRSVLEEQNLYRESLKNIGSIDLKSDEPGLLSFARDWELPLCCYTSEQLQQVSGVFSDSDFVRETTGVGNVCERSAVLASGGGQLFLNKRSSGGVTVALAMQEWSLNFE